MTRLAAPAPRAALLRPTAINTILAEVRQVRAEGTPVVSLMRGEPDFPTPPHIGDAAIHALRSGRTTYPDNRGEPGLRDAVAQKLKRDNALVYDPGHGDPRHNRRDARHSHGADGAASTTATVSCPRSGVRRYQSPILLAGGVIQPVRASIVRADSC